MNSKGKGSCTVQGCSFYTCIYIRIQMARQDRTKQNVLDHIIQCIGAMQVRRSTVTRPVFLTGQENLTHDRPIFCAGQIWLVECGTGLHRAGRLVQVLPPLGVMHSWEALFKVYNSSIHICFIVKHMPQMLKKTRTFFLFALVNTCTTNTTRVPHHQTTTGDQSLVILM